MSKQLKRLDGHYSAVAKVINVWRSTGTPAKIFDAFVQRRGHDWAKSVARRLPPRALKGRWGSIHSSEAFLLRAGHEDLPEVFAQSVGLPAGKDMSLDLATLAEGVLDMDSATYSRVMGRWRQESVLALQSSAFWLQLSVAQNSRQPLEHLMNWLMSNATSEPLEPPGCDGFSVEGIPSAGKLPILVWSKLDAIMAEFDHVLDPEWCEWQLFQSLLSGESHESEGQWVACLVATSLEIASEMNRRIVQYLCGFPGKLAWLIYEGPEVECNVRKAVAAELLVRDDLDKSFTLKFVDLYRDDLTSCSISGNINPQVHQLLLDFAQC